ncbi:hypothetical protein [Modestobacter roseus]|uniref:Uncharacterized protein n=1 Tax=Modestobacter roseus TaxID=1181884 RepID=A0A562IPJ6_9ACTN|nr:hypothetical protein [Modestobacter roseus]MQA34194.1 hypothetical protein [Modestobacter roseus]TWH72514.1 hypothetical protein JD78_01030 [Modestobacter roseus]
MRRVLPWSVLALGLGLAVAGVTTFWLANTRPSHVVYSGSYEPLVPGTSEAYRSELTLTFDAGPTVLWTEQHVVGVGLLLTGLFVLVGLGGWVLGRRSRRG